jgi:hypothetical protein
MYLACLANACATSSHRLNVLHTTQVADFAAFSAVSRFDCLKVLQLPKMRPECFRTLSTWHRRCTASLQLGTASRVCYKQTNNLGGYMKYMNRSLTAAKTATVQEKAKIVKTFDTEHAVLELSEKNCVIIRKKTVNGLKWTHNIQASQALMHAEFGCPVFQSIVDSPEFQANIENREKNKVLDKVQEELAKHQATAQKMFQASVDRLVATGRYTPETATALLTGKAG